MQHACPQVTRQNLVIKYLLTQSVFAFYLVFLLSFCLSIGIHVSLGLHTLFGDMTQVLSCPFAYETSLMFHIMVRVRVYCLCACVWYTSVTPKHPSWWLVSQFSARPRRFQTQSSKTGGYLLEMDLFRILASFCLYFIAGCVDLIFGQKWNLTMDGRAQRRSNQTDLSSHQTMRRQEQTICRENNEMIAHLMTWAGIIAPCTLKNGVQ